MEIKLQSWFLNYFNVMPLLFLLLYKHLQTSRLFLFDSKHLLRAYKWTQADKALASYSTWLQEMPLSHPVKSANIRFFELLIEDKLGWTNNVYWYMLRNVVRIIQKIASTPTFCLSLSTLKLWLLTLTSTSSSPVQRADC